MILSDTAIYSHNKWQFATYLFILFYIIQTYIYLDVYIPNEVDRVEMTIDECKTTFGKLRLGSKYR